MKNNVIEFKLFEVECKCGHVGKSRYIPVIFPIKAESGKEAARIARALPRVKHDQKDAILRVSKIDNDRFFELTEKNNQDPYLHCLCIQDQNYIDISSRLCYEDKSHQLVIRNDENCKDFYRSKRKIRNAKKYLNRYSFIEEINDICA